MITTNTIATSPSFSNNICIELGKEWEFDFPITPAAQEFVLKYSLQSAISEIDSTFHIIESEIRRGVAIHEFFVQPNYYLEHVVTDYFEDFYPICTDDDDNDYHDIFIVKTSYPTLYPHTFRESSFGFGSIGRSVCMIDEVPALLKQRRH